jgi:hypothetical protein
MALSDACGDFIAALSEGTAPHKELIKKLHKEVFTYASDGDSRGEFLALETACLQAWGAPSSNTASRKAWLAPLIRLVVLAEQIRAFHDGGDRQVQAREELWARAGFSGPMSAEAAAQQIEIWILEEAEPRSAAKETAR